MPASGETADICPLCDEHPHEVMLLAPVIRKAKEGRRIAYAFACPEPGCARLFDITYGYYSTTADGNVKADSVKFVACSEDQRAMFISEFNLRTREVMWQCTRPSCESRAILPVRP